MATPTPLPVRRALDTIASQLSTWRRLRGLTAEQVADRAGVSRGTVAALESGRGASLENTLRVARALGVLDLIVRAADPYATDLGRARAAEDLPRRVRRSGPRRSSSPKTVGDSDG
jgi:transcriptional regulator with XRE-family HTH domain